MDAATMAFESNTIAFRIGDGTEWGRGVPISAARAMFERYIPAGDGWKNPIDVDVLTYDAVVFMNAVQFYHSQFPDVRPGRTPGTVRIIGTGYVG